MPGGEIYNSRANFTNIWEQLGLERPEVPPGFETVFDLVHPDDRERLDRAIQDYLSGKTSQFEVDHRVRREDGSFRWLLTRGVAVRDPAGRPIRFIGSCIDVTDHRHAEEALRESEGRFRGTFENAAVGIAHKDADGRFLRVNETYCEIVGYTRARAARADLPGHHLRRGSGDGTRAIPLAHAGRIAQLLAGEAVHP